MTPEAMANYNPGPLQGGPESNMSRISRTLNEFFVQRSNAFSVF
jgi:hypothetical protein